ncbi:heparin lyase I family protein [Microvirga sp. 17 mud 1-3]|uniref:heparin lyase I family protein n=1 Tax=Microvirga sp. 17 mud 1-3 TaxID=2082949 RepID=UPI000D6B4E02|nr:heparin lyase I family protein [Microvirga sp. 17 mud 1-3]AWM86798.1 hypothetical protein C4E04_08725 [Microvirga sp. 17 mud 1-3]
MITLTVPSNNGWLVMAHYQRSFQTFSCFAAMIGASLLAAPAYSQTIRDDFTGSTISTENWFVCQRDENEFKITAAPGQPFRGVRTLVHPRTDQLTSEKFAHSGCRTPGGPYQPGKDERAELWEADDISQEIGTDVWYRFSMYIDPAIRQTSPRLVIGQWKQPGGFSPIVAQRFDGRSFKITIQQDNDTPSHPDDLECRIWVAVDGNSKIPVGSSVGHSNTAIALKTKRPEVSGPILPSMDIDVDDGLPDITSKSTIKQSCKAGLKIETFGKLPGAFNRWTEMVYHIRAKPNKNGLLEVWADGKPIVRVTGRIGYRTAPGISRQYFKFGPYRNREPYDAYAMIATYRRGSKQVEVQKSP